MSRFVRPKESWQTEAVCWALASDEGRIPRPMELVLWDPRWRWDQGEDRRQGHPRIRMWPRYCSGEKAPGGSKGPQSRA